MALTSYDAFVFIRLGPNIDFLKLCLDWWDRFLKGKGDSSLQSDPLLTLYLQERMQPAPQSEHRGGRWVTAQEWPTNRDGFTSKARNPASILMSN